MSDFTPFQILSKPNARSKDFKRYIKMTLTFGSIFRSFFLRSDMIKNTLWNCLTFYQFKNRSYLFYQCYCCFFGLKCEGFLAESSSHSRSAKGCQTNQDFSIWAKAPKRTAHFWGCCQINRGCAMRSLKNQRLKHLSSLRLGSYWL